MSDGLELTKYEELIYNTHLRVSRTRQSKPFRYRKDFTSIDDKTKIYLKKISLFLEKFEHIKLDEFIVAPYEIYKDENYFELDYYTTLKATKAYTLFQTSKLYESPDSEYHLNNIIESLNFIQKFCKQHELKLAHYLKHCPDKVPSFFIHLKEHKVNIYTLLGFKDFTKELRGIDAELAKFILGEELYNRVDTSRTKLFGSQKALPLISKGLQIIEKKLEEKS